MLFGRFVKWTSILVAFLSVCYYFISDMPSELQEWSSRMGEAALENREKFKEMGKSAFVLGATGESGKALLRELQQSQTFARLVLIGRREIQLDEELSKNVEQKVVDFDKIDEYADAFRDTDVGFCCLGTTRGKAGKEGFYKVDHDYVVNAARVAKAAGCRHFNLVTSQGSNKNSNFLYPKTKGEAEDHVAGLGFDRLTIYRPGVLMCDRQESRPMEAAFRFLMKPMAAAFPTAMTTPTTVLAKAMVNAVVSPGNQSVEILENKAIFAIAGKQKSKKEKS